jgi:hypothetical protein
MGTKPIRLRALHCLALWMVLSLGPFCFGEMPHPLVVRVLNGRDGQRLAGQLVTLHLSFGKASGVEHNLVLVYQTDSNGEVRVPMPEITPENLDVAVTLKANDLHCPRHVFTRIETVMREGLMVASHSRTRNPSTMQAAPGEIVFVARPPGILEKMLYDY